MSITEVEQQQLLIGGEWAGAGSGGTFERSDPLTGEAATRAAAAGREDARARGRRRRRGLPRVGRHAAVGERRELLQKAADAADGARAGDRRRSMTEETGGTFGWGMFNCDSGRRDAARGRRADLRR